jgi:hypothetical protein
VSLRTLKNMFATRPVDMVGQPIASFLSATAIWEDTDGCQHIRFHDKDILTFMDPDDRGVFRWVEITIGDQPSIGVMARVNDILYGDYQILDRYGYWLVRISMSRPHRYGSRTALLELRQGMRLPIEYDTRVLL